MTDTTWILFWLVWAIGGLWFALTDGVAYVEQRSVDEVSWSALIAIVIGSGPIIWAGMIALAVWGDE